MRQWNCDWDETTLSTLQLAYYQSPARLVVPWLRLCENRRSVHYRHTNGIHRFCCLNRRSAQRCEPPCVSPALTPNHFHQTRMKSMSKQFVSALPAACVASTSPSSIKNRMNTLIQQADAWDKGANITAKQQLYALLQQCYQLSAELSDLATEGEFRAYITEHTPKFRFRKNTSTISLILRTVFSARRRQVSARDRHATRCDAGHVTRCAGRAHRGATRLDPSAAR